MFFCQNCGQSIEAEIESPNPNDSFIVLEEINKTTISQKLSIADKLYKLNKNDPMCDECAVELSEILSRQIKNYQAETDQYQQYLNSHPDQIDATFFQNLSNQLNEQEQLIHNLETDQQQTDLEIKSHLLKLAEIKIQEKEYFKKLNILDMEVREFDDQFESTNLQLKSAKERLDQLQNTNVYNDAFRIWHNGPFGTINDLRLGRLDNIEWQEINAGIGLAVLLLDSLAVKVGFVFKGYKLLPMGSVSKIEKIDGDRVSYGLYGSSDFTGLFSNRRFDLGLVAFLGCIKELGDYAVKKDSRFELPYKINKDQIGEDGNIKMQGTSNQVWTKALKYMLVDLKWLIAFCCS